MQKRGLLVMLIVAVCALLVSSVFAQNTPDPELIDFVQAAYDEFFALESYSASGTQTVVQHIVAKTQGQTVTVDQTIEQNLDGQVQNSDGEVGMSMQIDQTIDQKANGQNQKITQTLEIILAEGDLFMRFSDVTPAAMAALFPKDWVNLTEDPTAFPGANVINTSQYTEVFSNQFKYPLNDETVERIKELPGETLDGVDTRVVKLVFNAPELFASGQMDQVLSGFNTQQLGLDMDQLRESMGENAALELTLWIGADDNLIYRQDTIMSIAGDMGAIAAGIDSMNLEQQVTGTITFSDFNEPVTIEAPET